MKVFISWAGKRSHHVATALKEFIPDVLKDAEAWLSSDDIPKGTRPLEEIRRALDDARVGIICLTADNTNSPWILFEAGALSRALDAKTNPVCTYLLDLGPSDVPQGPLSQFQHTRASAEETLQMLKDLNNVSDKRLEEERIARIFHGLWPEFEKKLQAIPKETSPSNEPRRSDREILEEILDLTRETARSGTEASLRSSLTAKIQRTFATKRGVGTIRIVAAAGNRRDAILDCGFCGEQRNFHFYDGEGSPKLNEVLNLFHYRDCPVRLADEAAGFVMSDLTSTPIVEGFVVFYPETSETVVTPFRP